VQICRRTACSKALTRAASCDKLDSTAYRLLSNIMHQPLFGHEVTTYNAKIFTQPSSSTFSARTLQTESKEGLPTTAFDGSEGLFFFGRNLWKG
jgi:hypothetical protein